MCGRYSFVPTQEQIERELSELDLPDQLRINYNVAPTQSAYVIANDRPHQIQEMRWGLVPHWSKDGKLSGKMINARSEGIESKSSFRSPIRRRRCLVPADSFYEWRTSAGGKKIPYRIKRKDGRLLMMAGIWDEWEPGRLRTFSIITTDPNQEMESLHNRMPVILEPEAREHWLEVIPVEEVLPMLLTAPDDSLEYYRVSEKLNKVGSDGSELHKPVPEETDLFGDKI